MVFKSWKLAGFCVTMVAGCAAILGASTTPALGSSGYPNPLAPTNCAFGFEYDVDIVPAPVFGPDDLAAYYVENITYEPGEKVVFKGQFANARFSSFAVYDANGQIFTANGVKDSLADYLIEPDPGSINPWQRPGLAGKRPENFTITLTNAAAPGMTNTLPLTPAGTASGATVWIMYRIYDPAGGTPAGFASQPVPPSMTIDQGSTSTTVPGCAKHGRASAAYMPLVTSTGSSSSSDAPLQFYAPDVTDLLAINPDESYVLTSFLAPPPTDVTVITGKAPTAPTSDQPSKWPNPKYDEQFWSMCIQYHTVLVENPTLHGTDYGCRHNEQTNVNAAGDFMYVIGPEALRKQIEAIPGATFLPLADNTGTANYTLMYRNLVVNPSFTHAPNSLPETGADAATTAAVMGAYYPQGYTCPLIAFEESGLSACTEGSPYPKS